MNKNIQNSLRKTDIFLIDVLKEKKEAKSIDLEKSQIYFETEEYIVFYKAAGLPSAPLKEINLENLNKDTSLFFYDSKNLLQNKSNEEYSALKEVAKHAPEVLNISSKFKAIEAGLVHRIDTATSGLLLFAKNQRAYDFFIENQNNERFFKSYIAFSESYTSKNTQAKLMNRKQNGFPSLPEKYQNSKNNKLPFVVYSAFRNFGHKGASVRPVLLEQVQEKKIYQTRIDKVEDFSTEHNKSIKKIYATVTKAYRHQVRSHLSWIGYPILGDERYGLNVRFASSETQSKEDCQNRDEKKLIRESKNYPMLFFASSLSFVEPQTNKRKTYALVEENLDAFVKKIWSSETK